MTRDNRKPPRLADVPERELFETVDEADEFARSVMRRDNWNVRLIFPAIVCSAVFVLLPLYVVDLLRDVVPWPGGFTWWQRGTLLAGVAAYTWFCLRGYRRGLRQELRNELARRGVPICPHCHYCLKSVSDARCPECGKAIAQVENDGPSFDRHG